MDTNFNLLVSDHAGGVHVVHIVSSEGHDWRLAADLYGTPYTKRCYSWQAVERHLTWLRRHAPEHRAAPPARPGSIARAAMLAWLFLSTITAIGVAQTLPPASPPVAAFVQATRDYADMHRRLEREIGPIDINTPIESINRRIQELSAAIGAERRDAQQGDLFTPALARELRVRINDALFAHDFTAADVLAAARVDGIDYERVRLRVNGTFPWVLSTAMFPCIIEALPPLPPELQYRIVGHDLLLVDVHAGLIVDILPQALPDLTALAR